MKRSISQEIPTETPSSYPTPSTEELFKAILALKDKEEAKKFFRDLLTMAELTEFANRWQIVKLLARGHSYLTIAQKLKVSTATVTRVAHWFYSGMGGYQSVAARFFKKSHTS